MTETVGGALVPAGGGSGHPGLTPRRVVVALVSLLCLLGAAGGQPISSNFTIGHLVYLPLMGLLGIWALVLCPARVLLPALAVAAVVLVNIFMLQGFGPGLPDNLVPGSFRTLYYLAAIVILTTLFGLDDLGRILFAAAIGFTLFAVVTMALNLSELFLFSGRLSLTPEVGPNQYGGIAALNAVVFASQTSRARRLLGLPFLLVNMICLALFFSRGALLALAIAMLVGPGLGRRMLMVAVMGLIAILLLSTMVDIDTFLQQANVISKIQSLSDPDKGSSGRLDLWSGMLMDQISQPVTLFFGFGPGSVELPWIRAFPYSWKILESPHSTFVGILYFYGLIGLAMLLCIGFRCAVLAFRVNHSVLQQRIFVFYAVTFLVDAYWLSGATFLFHGLGFAVAMAHRLPAMSDPDGTFGTRRVVAV